MDNPTTQSPNSELIVVGKISSAHGIKGWVNVYSYTNPVTNILQYQPWFLASRGAKDAWTPINVIASRPQGKQVVAQFEGCQDRNQAELYRGLEIAINRSQLPKLAHSGYYWIDLIGLTVVTVSGEELGQVDSLIATGANDVLIVKGKGKEHLIPYVQDEFVQEVDLESRRITVDWDPNF
jgi:16S rRNA processing protein RimM